MESSGGVQTLRNASAYNEPAWHFDVTFVSRDVHKRANVQKAPGHGHFFGDEEYSVPFLMISLIQSECHLYSLQDKRL